MDARETRCLRTKSSSIATLTRLTNEILRIERMTSKSKVTSKRKHLNNTPLRLPLRTGWQTFGLISKIATLWIPWASPKSTRCTVSRSLAHQGWCRQTSCNKIVKTRTVWCRVREALAMGSTVGFSSPSTSRRVYRILCDPWDSLSTDQIATVSTKALSHTRSRQLTN